MIIPHHRKELPYDQRAVYPPVDPFPQRWSTLFLAIAVLFVTCLLVANIIAVKLVRMAFVLLPVGMLI